MVARFVRAALVFFSISAVLSARGLDLLRTCTAGGGAIALTDGANSSLGCTSGQSVAGTMTGGGYTLVSGFWGRPGSAGDTYSLSGTVTYAGSQSGSVIVQVFLNSAFTGTPVRSVAADNKTPAAYAVPNLPAATYYVRAFVDADSDLSPDPAEAQGAHAGSVNIDAADVTDVNLTLADPDTDSDQLPDCWEQAYFGNLDQGAGDDPDDDGFTNLYECVHGGNPLVRELILTHGWNLVSMPFRCSQQIVQQFLSGKIVGRMWAWDGQHYQPTNKIKPLAGVWIYRDDPDPVSIPIDTRSLQSHQVPTSLARDDADGDGMADAWELAYFATLADCAPDADPDRDGTDNLDEFLEGSDPTRYVLKLTPGWNLMSLAQARPADPSPAKVLGAHVKGSVWVWENGAYREAKRLRPLRGHWVFCPGVQAMEVEVIPDTRDREEHPR